MKTRSPKIGVYAGSGTSHSWLWFVDLFEKQGFYDLVFLDEFAIQDQKIHGLDVLVISGGDTFGVAEHLGKKGAVAIDKFVARGGIYVGSCAGAYLPMKSSQKPLDLFNFVDVKITNLSKFFPKEDIQVCKSCTAYGYDYVFHPVREAMALKTTSNLDPDTRLEFNAPLYGGPGMEAKKSSWVLAAYEDFTPKTLHLTTRKIADQVLLGKGAVVRVPFGQGCFYLLGPHLEHPRYKQANQFIIDALIRETAGHVNPEPARDRCPLANAGDKPEILTGKEAKKLILSIKRELSNSRITATGLEFMPVQWLIGKKVYDPQKIRVFLEAMWKRVRPLEKKKILVLTPALSERITTSASRITLELRKIRKLIDEKQDSLETAVIIFDQLHILSMSFFDLYFETLFKVEDLCPPKKKTAVRKVEAALTP